MNRYRLAAAGFVLLVSGMVVVRVSAGVWWDILMMAWTEALTDPGYRHEDWIRVDILGTFQSFLRVAFSSAPIGMTAGSLLAVSGLGVLAWGALAPEWRPEL